MKKTLLFFALVFILGFLTTTSQSCSKKLPADTLPAACDTLTISYNSGIADIINRSCAYSGCHINGDVPGDFSTYQGMKSRLENGAIFDRVITQKDNSERRMPPTYAPAGYPTELTPGELDMIHCWIADNYPEN